MKKTICVCILFFLSVAVFSLPESVVFKRYTPPFYQWVFVYLSVSYVKEVAGVYYLYLVFDMDDTGNMKFTFHGGVNMRDKKGRDYYYKTLPEIKEAVKYTCQGWTLEGPVLGKGTFAPTE